ncbi:MAG TPA: DUF4129 domain-containing protein [Mycobacterium sp.]|jgi:hypothetical protein
MPGADRAWGRAIGLIALVILTGVALRGYLPGETHDAEKQPTNSPAAMIAVLTLLAAAVAIITVAIIATLREPRPARQAGGDLPNRRDGEGFRPTWRWLMIALAVLIVWLLIVVLLMRLGARLDADHPASQPAATTPAPGPGQAPPPPGPPPPGESQGDLFWPLFGTTVAMVAIWAAGIAVALLRRRRKENVQSLPAAAEPMPDAPGPPPLAVAAERGLAEMGDLSREPREAIIACYAAMEGALANAPEVVPQDSDTPSEVLARAVEHGALHAGSATELVGLFAEARFSPHVMTEAHREAAVAALELVLAELRSLA